MLVAAAKKYEKVVQMGNQQRSSGHTIEIINEIEIKCPAANPKAEITSFMNFEILSVCFCLKLVIVAFLSYFSFLLSLVKTDPLPIFLQMLKIKKTKIYNY